MTPAGCVTPDTMAEIQDMIAHLQQAHKGLVAGDGSPVFPCGLSFLSAPITMPEDARHFGPLAMRQNQHRHDSWIGSTGMTTSAKTLY